MAGGRHAARPDRSLSHRLANALCSTVVVVGLGVVLLGARASGYAEVTEPDVVAAGQVVLPAGLHPGGVVTGQLPVRDAGADEVDIDAPVADAAHAACGSGGVTLTIRPATAGSMAEGITFTASMSRAARDACQGATFTSTYRIKAGGVGGSDLPVRR
jgi:hypothetical protein